MLLLASHFARQITKRYGFPPAHLTPESNTVIKQSPWPGNVRELKHMIERAVLLSGGGDLTPDDLSLTQASRTDSEPELLLDENVTLQSVELTLIKNALERANGNVSKAARDLDITRMALRYRLKKYNL